jgi:pimeloyl-ACP methyl ester carboxylesterase
MQPAQEIKNATPGAHRGARCNGVVAACGARAAAGVAGDRGVSILRRTKAMSGVIELEASGLAVETGGSGDPALFVHGLGSSRASWRDVCHGLRDVFSFYAIDLPGSGETPAPRHFDYTLEHLADVLTDFIIMKDLKRLTLVGTSLGASVILLAILRNKDELAPRLRSLCLIDAIAYPQHFSFFVKVLKIPIFLAPVFGLQAADFLWPERRRIREAMIETVSLIDVEHFARYVPRLKTIHLPTLVIWGREDEVVPLRLGKRLARDLPRSRLIIIDDCGHEPHEECPAEVIAALKQFAH